MSIALWVIGLVVATWLCVCAGISVWYRFTGHNIQHEEGDSLWAVLVILPLVPFMIGFYKAKEFLQKKL